MAALCEMKLNLQLAKYQHSDDPPDLGALQPGSGDSPRLRGRAGGRGGPGRRWARPQRVLMRYEAQTHTVPSYLCEIGQQASQRSYLGKRASRS